MNEAKPAYVSDLEAVYGPPAEEGFGSAAFFLRTDGPKDLEELAREVYCSFVGALWERWGEDAWMGPWRQVYARPDAGTVDAVAELRGISDAEAKRSLPLLLEVPGNADAVLATAFNDPAVTEFRVFNIGDGEAVSGLLVAGQRTAENEAVFIVALMD